MEYFNKEQIEILKEYDKYFYTSVYLDYKRATIPSENKKVADIYEQVTGEKLPLNHTCGTCIFNLFKKVGKLYYESIEHLKDEVETTETNPNKPKRGRPKKTVSQ